MPTLIDTIVCESIRQEANNKMSLLGIFGDEILVPRFPYQFPSLAVFQRWALTDEEFRHGSVLCRVDFTLPQGTPLGLPETVYQSILRAHVHLPSQSRSAVSCLTKKGLFPLRQRSTTDLSMCTVSGFAFHRGRK